MADLQNKFPSWGESGTLPKDGFFYQSGEQVNEKHLDGLWNTLDAQTSQLITGMRDRVRDVEGDFILDGGLVTSTTANTREVSVSASTDGAYVDGQKTGSTSSTTITFTANGGTTTRTDSVWVDTTGTVGKSEGTTSVATDRAKIAEVDISSSDTISAVRNKGRDRARVFASETAPDSFFSGDVWYDRNNSTTKIYSNGSAREVFFADGSNPLTGDVDLNGNVLTDGDGVVNISGDLADGATTLWDTSAGHIPESSVQQGAGSGLDADTVDGVQASEFKALEPRGIVDEWTYNAPANTTGSYTRTYDVVDATFLGMMFLSIDAGPPNGGDGDIDVRLHYNDGTTSAYKGVHSFDSNLETKELYLWDFTGATNGKRITQFEVKHTYSNGSYSGDHDLTFKVAVGENVASGI